MDGAGGVGGSAELEEAAIAECLLAEAGSDPSDQVLEPGQRGSALLVVQVLHDRAEQVERFLLAVECGQEDLGVALRWPVGQLDDVSLGHVVQQLAERSEAVLGLVERRVLA